MTITFSASRIVSDTNYLFGIPYTILSEGLWEDTGSDFAKTEYISQAITVSVTVSFEVSKYHRWTKSWRDELSLDAKNKLNEEALKAVEELKLLLKISEKNLAKLVDISRNSFRNWRNGQGAYPSTTSKLFQILHLISALKLVMSQRQMLAWLNEPDNKNPSFTRLDILSQPDGPALVSQQASHILFSPPPGSLPSPDELRKELERLDLEEQGWVEEYGEVPRRYSARPRRQRPDGNASK